MTDKQSGNANVFEPGRKIDIRVLEAIAMQDEVQIILYFEDELARSSRYEHDVQTYMRDPEHERPFIEIKSFLKFQREMSPYFNEALITVPLMVTIVSTTESYNGSPIIKGVLPFLDELDVT
jgi:hypothetical protein